MVVLLGGEVVSGGGNGIDLTRRQFMIRAFHLSTLFSLSFLTFHTSLSSFLVATLSCFKFHITTYMKLLKHLKLL